MRPHHDARAIERARRRTVEETLAAQRRVISRAQAVAAGVTIARIDQMIRSRRWRRVHTGIYTDADPSADDVRVWASWLWGGSGAVLAGQAALYWVGLAASVPHVIDLYLPSSRSRQLKHDIRFRRGHVQSRDTDWHYGLRVTSPSRSAIDLARWGSPDSFLEVIMRRVERGREQLESALTRCRTLPGYPAAVRAVRRG
jgi:hypothetical protein